MVDEATVECPKIASILSLLRVTLLCGYKVLWAESLILTQWHSLRVEASAPNIIPDHAVLKVDVRAYNHATLEKAVQAFKRIVKDRLSNITATVYIRPRN